MTKKNIYIGSPRGARVSFSGRYSKLFELLCRRSLSIITRWYLISQFSVDIGGYFFSAHVSNTWGTHSLMIGSNIKRGSSQRYIVLFLRN